MLENDMNVMENGFGVHFGFFKCKDTSGDFLSKDNSLKSEVETTK